MKRVLPRTSRIAIGLAELVIIVVLLVGPTASLFRHPVPTLPAVPHRTFPSRAEPVADAVPPVPASTPPAAETPVAAGSAPAAAAPAANTPARLLIPAIAVSTRVEHLGTGPDGAMETPHNLNNVGWFSPGVRPGERGDAVIDGHVGLPGQPLVFAHLDRLRLGDAISVITGDGRSARFIVSSSRVVPAGSRPPGLFATDGAPTLSLITCTGQYDGGNYSYAERLIVDARYAGTD